jgi:hypothetical protein
LLSDERLLRLGGSRQQRRRRLRRQKTAGITPFLRLG